MKTISRFRDKLQSGKTLEHGQHDNGMHWATIRDERGRFESGILCDTAVEKWRWLANEQEEELADDNA